LHTKAEARREKALAQLVYIALPASLDRDLGGFKPDPGIALPVEPGGSTEAFDPRQLSPEAIVAGMLRLLAWDPDHEHADYYRGFVRAAKPELLAALSEAGIAKAQLREWEVAEEIFLALAGLYPETPEPQVDLAVLYENWSESLAASGDEAESEGLEAFAFDRYKVLLAREPPFPEAFFNAGFFFLRRKNYERASSLFETYSRIGENQEHCDRAREIVKRLEGQGYLDELFKEAYDFIRLGREAEGLEKARLFLERNPMVWNAWFLTGWALRRQRRWEEGRLAFEKAIELGAEGTDVYNELSICLLELDRVAEARRNLEIALGEEPENVKIITNLGAIALRQGRASEAAGFFRAALEIEPDDAAAAGWLAEVED
jgi:tetratricopeptide (TPR) repeat protein